MNSRLPWRSILLASELALGVMLADEANGLGSAPVAQPPTVGELDNFFFDVGGGVEKPPGEDRTAFGTAGVNWGIPLTPPSGVALGLQAGGDLKLRDDNPEWNATLGGFARNVTTFQNRQGATALLFDYRHTAHGDDLWAVRPVVGTTISARDALGIESVTGLNQQRAERMINSLASFWTRRWSGTFGTEFGAGYEFKRVNDALFRFRAAIGLTRSLDMWCGGDVNSGSNYAVGLGLSYHFGATGAHDILHNIGGTGSELYTPFPTADFPGLLTHTK